jgi:cell shape-determining protein MreC
VTGPIALQEKLDAAQSENIALRVEVASLTATAADLAALLGSRTEPSPGILAGVILAPPMSPYDVLIVDQGSSDGVASGALATGPGGVPIGEVLSVTEHAARVELFSAPGREVPALVGETRAPLILTGEGAGAFAANAPADTGISAGDLVYITAGGAFAIGTVVAVEHDATSPSAAIRIQPMVNPFSLTWVVLHNLRL